MAKTNVAELRFQRILQGTPIVPTNVKLDLVTDYTDLEAGQYTVANYPSYAAIQVMDKFTDGYIDERVQFPAVDAGHADVVVKRLVLSISENNGSTWIPWLYTSADYALSNATIKAGEAPSIKANTGFVYTED